MAHSLSRGRPSSQGVGREEENVFWVRSITGLGEGEGGLTNLEKEGRIIVARLSGGVGKTGMKRSNQGEKLGSRPNSSLARGGGESSPAPSRKRGEEQVDRILRGGKKKGIILSQERRSSAFLKKWNRVSEGEKAESAGVIKRLRRKMV